MSIASYQQRLANLHYRHVKGHAFKAGDLVLRGVFENTANPADGKFQANWEGPHTVVRVGTAGSYALSKLDGTAIPRMWNAMHLKKYYQSCILEEIIINKRLYFIHFLLKPTIASS